MSDQLDKYRNVKALPVKYVTDSENIKVYLNGLQVAMVTQDTDNTFVVLLLNIINPDEPNAAIKFIPTKHEVDKLIREKCFDWLTDTMTGVHERVIVEITNKMNAHGLNMLVEENITTGTKYETGQ